MAAAGWALLVIGAVAIWEGAHHNPGSPGVFTAFRTGAGGGTVPSSPTPAAG